MTAAILSGRGAVVTGGGRGIGEAVARALAEAGARVMVAARTAGEVDRVASDLRDRGADAWAVSCDVTEEHEVRRLGEAARGKLATVDILVNNAGAGASAPLGKIALDDWNHMLAANATTTFLCTREFAPAMAGRGWGRVVNVASVAGLEGAKYVAHYSAAKHAVVGFTRSVALEVAGTGVTVNAVCPGYVETPMIERTLAGVQARTGKPREEALAMVLGTTGQDRLVTPGEVASAVLALCGDAASETNGETIVLNPRANRMNFEIVNPESLGAPRGWNHGLLAPRGGRHLFVAGQAGWEPGALSEPAGFVEQFSRALDKVLAVVRAAGGQPTDVARLTVYVVDLAAYRAHLKPLGEAWRARFGKFYPAMTLVEVKGLADRGALLEIEATAVIGGHL